MNQSASLSLSSLPNPLPTAAEPSLPRAVCRKDRRLWKIELEGKEGEGKKERIIFSRQSSKFNIHTDIVSAVVELSRLSFTLITAL